MPIELTTADSNTITSIRSTLSAANSKAFIALSAGEVDQSTDTRVVINPDNNSINLCLSPVERNQFYSQGSDFTSAEWSPGEGEGVVVITNPSDNLKDFLLNKQLRYPSVKIEINQFGAQMEINRFSVQYDSNNNNLSFTTINYPEEFTVAINNITIWIVSNQGIYVNGQDPLTLSTDQENIVIESIDRDITLRAGDDVRIESTDLFSLRNKWDGGSKIEFITNYDSGNISEKYFAFNGDGKFELPNQIRFVNANYEPQSSSIYTQPLSSGDGNGYTTIELHPDESRSEYDQYVVIDPTAPNHIHIRAGGQQDNSNAELILGGELGHVKIGTGATPDVRIKSNNQDFIFDVVGNVMLPSNGSVKFGARPLRVVGVPAQSTGVAGDNQGDIAFDENYIYYCIENFGGLQHYVVHGIAEGTSADGVNNGYLVYSNFQLPQVGWRVTYNGSTSIINQVNSSNSGYYIVFVDTALVIPGQASFTWGPVPSTNIWKRIDFATDTW